MVETKVSADEQIELDEKVQGFDVDAALNTKGFTEFLARFPDSETIDVKKGKEIEKRFEVFGTIDEVKEGMKKIYSGEIQRDMGLKLDEVELSLIDNHLEELAITNPREIMKLKDRVSSFRELPKQIAQYEAQIAALGKSEDLLVTLEQKKKDRDQLNIARGYSGIVGKTKYAMMHLRVGFKGLSHLEEMFMKRFSKDYVASPYYEQFEEDVSRAKTDRKAVAAVGEKYIGMDRVQIETIIGSVNDDIAETERMLSAITNLDALKKESANSFNKLRKKLVGSVSEIDGVRLAVQGAAQVQLNQMLSSGSIDGIKQAQKRFEDLNRAGEETATKIDPLEGFDQEKFQQDLDTAIQRQASEQIKGTIMSTDLGTNSLTKMEKALIPFLKESKLGSLEGDEAREFLKKTIREAADKLGSTIKDKAKKIIISRILVRMEN